MNHLRIAAAHLGRTITLAALLLAALAVLWAAKDQALATRTSDTSTEQPAGPAGSGLPTDTTTPSSTEQASSTPVQPATSTPSAPAITSTETSAPPPADPTTLTPAPVVTTNAQGDVGPVPVSTQPKSTSTTSEPPPCTTAGCPGT